MLKFYTRIFLVLASALVFFAAGAGVAIIRGWGSPVVRVDVVNKTTKQVVSIILEQETCGTKSRVVGTPLKSGQRSTFSFLVCGEGSYQLSIRFADGTELVGGGSYVESGYHFLDTIEADHISLKPESYFR